MIELVLSEQVSDPVVERLDGPRVRVSINPEHTLADAISKCRPDLHQAVEWALTTLYENDEAPHRVYVRDANGQAMVAMTDPCVNYGSQAIIRP